MLLKIRTVLGEIAMSPQQPCYEAFISPKRFRALLGKNFSQKFLNMACYTFGNLKIRTLKPNRFENKTNNNSNYLQGFVKQNIAAVHCCGFLS